MMKKKDEGCEKSKFFRENGRASLKRQSKQILQIFISGQQQYNNYLINKMKNDSFVKLYPPQPLTDSKLTIVVENCDRQSLIVNIQGWKRITPHQTSVALQSREGLSYQCTPLDLNCCIQVKLLIKVKGKLMQHSVVSQPIKLAKQIRQRMLYVIEPIGCRTSIDEFTVFLSTQVENRKIKFLGELGKCEINLQQNIIEIDPVQNGFRLHLQQAKNDFVRFFCECLHYIPKIRSNFCYCLFNTKLERDLILALVAENLYNYHAPCKSNSGTLTPRNDKSLKNNGSSSSLTSYNRNKNKTKEKVKISERLNIKRSYSKFSASKNAKDETNNEQCLNIFQDDDIQDTKNNRSMNTPDTAMDLRGSFEELEQKSFSKLQEEKLSEHSFRQLNTTKAENSFQVENRKLRQENNRLRKQVDLMSQSVREAQVMKKKYLTAVQEINRLENERRAIITDKVRFESSYHREVQEKEELRRELQSLKQLTMGKTGRF